MNQITAVFMPYWSKVTPPYSIGQIKRFISEKTSTTTRCYDVNVDEEVETLYALYGSILEKKIPEEKRAGFDSILEDVICNHMSAYCRQVDKDDYIALVKQIIEYSFLFECSLELIESLNDTIRMLFQHLEKIIKNIITKSKPDIMIFDVTNMNCASVYFAIRYIKTHFHQIKIVLGGAIFFWQVIPETEGFEHFYRIVRPFVDKIFIGQEKELMVDYINGELDVEQILYYPIESIVESENDNYIIPDLDDFNIKQYLYLPATASISCIYHCSFCVANKMYGTYRSRNVERVISEIEQLKNTYQRQLFFLSDSMVNIVILDLCRELLRRRVHIYFDAFYRIDENATKIENLTLMRKAGFYKARLGIESGSQRLLDIMNKGTKVETIKKAVKALADAGIKTTTLWIVGHPGEDNQDFQDTLDLITEMKDDIYEVQCNQFIYYHTTQKDNSGREYHAKLKYEEKLQDMLLIKAWELEDYPTNKVKQERLMLFEKHCKEIGIPIITNMEEMEKADIRWKGLHKNAVPSYTELVSNLHYNDKEHFEISHSSKINNLEEEMFEF